MDNTNKKFLRTLSTLPVVCHDQSHHRENITSLNEDFNLDRMITIGSCVLGVQIKDVLDIGPNVHNEKNCLLRPHLNNAPTVLLTIAHSHRVSNVDSQNLD